MQTSNKKISSQKQETINERFVTLLSDLKDPTECKYFFSSFLTKTEQNVFTKRLSIIWMLEQSYSYKEIKKELKVSSATISSIASQMKDKGTQLIVKKLKVDDWASQTASKLTSWLPF